MKSWVESGITQGIPLDLMEENYEDGSIAAGLHVSTPGFLQEEGGDT